MYTRAQWLITQPIATYATPASSSFRTYYPRLPKLLTHRLRQGINPSLSGSSGTTSGVMLNPLLTSGAAPAAAPASGGEAAAAPVSGGEVAAASAGEGKQPAPAAV